MIFPSRGGTFLVPPSFCLFTDWFRYKVTRPPSSMMFPVCSLTG